MSPRQSGGGGRGYTPAVRRDVIVHILLLAIGLQALVGGTAIFVGCHGHDHDRGPSAVGLCEFGHCPHERSAAAGGLDGHEHHGEHCDCIDVPATAPALAIPTRIDDAPVHAGLVPRCDERLTLADGADPSPTGPPRAPPWFDPGREYRLAVVASVRLTI